MIENTVFGEMVLDYKAIVEGLASIDIEELYLDYKVDFDEQFQNDMIRVKNAIILLRKARVAKDDLAVRAALMYIRIFTMRLADFFDYMKDDTLRLSNTLYTCDMPDNYQVPEHYNFPRY
ncbi:hypothetical protein ABK905_20440 [Acerihabitans sp. KWT182]|uniref:Uncharacterized protein n=1 Tax=Acerihabitans sp. KWT182 TaxID=3157919 RepID=A0AAU7Q7H7_9GAMM